MSLRRTRRRQKKEAGNGFLAAAAISLALWAGAAAAQPAAGGAPAGMRCAGDARPMVRLELIFGMARPGGRPVSQAEWIDFLEAEVTPRFPAGLTVLSGLGQWRGGDGRITREQSKLVVIWHEPDDGAATKIDAIRAAYKRRFDQESVMQVESLSCVSF